MKEVTSIIGTLTIQSMPANATFQVTIQPPSSSSVYWAISNGGVGEFTLAGSGNTSGVLEGLLATSTTLSLTNGGQTANWTLGVTIVYATGTPSFVVMPSFAGAGGAIVQFQTTGIPVTLTNNSPSTIAL
jgi:hypothetical protein